MYWKKDKKVQWHPGFYGAMHLELRENKDDLELTEEVTLSFIRERKPVKLFKKLRREKFNIEEKYAGIYYIIKESYFRIQVVVTKELKEGNHIWLNALSDKMREKQVLDFLTTAQELRNLDEKNYADSLWDIVASVNQQVVQKIREDEDMCKGLAEIMKPELDEAFNNGFNNGFNDGSMCSFKNMIKDGMSREQAQKYAGISDELVEKALAEMDGRVVRMGN